MYNVLHVNGNTFINIQERPFVLKESKENPIRLIRSNGHDHLLTTDGPANLEAEANTFVVFRFQFYLLPRQCPLHLHTPLQWRHRLFCPTSLVFIVTVTPLSRTEIHALEMQRLCCFEPHKNVISVKTYCSFRV
ncbi:hypothetical protein L2E82_18708 [Cichorium intybus]|uniref:Uncharacterized protein n=1 Tax=Cichorium intybus TaxID=13427 RepID=A0ACB9FAP5_CICIN|nr:hypothetical protein L2E82_18708 [Cichorium intybus]